MLPRTRGRSLPGLLVGTLLTVAVSVPLAAPAGAAADPIAGNWDVTYGAPAVVTMTLANGVYTETAATPVRVVSAACDLPPGTVIATFSASGPLTYTGQHGLWSTFDCSFAFFTPMTLSLSADGATLLGRLDGGATVTFTRPAPTPAPGPAPEAATCSRATARAVLLGRHLGDPLEPEGQVLCGHFTGRHSHAMVVSLRIPGCGGSIGWLVFRRHGGPQHGTWQVALDRHNGARLSAVGRRIRETLSILRPTDPHCLPTGGTRSRIWHWTGHGFVHTRFRHDPNSLTAPRRTEGAPASPAAGLASEIAAVVAPSRPVCTKAAVHRAIARQPPGYRWAVAELRCAGRYAVVGLADLTDQVQFTRLLHWTRTDRWRVVDLIRACARGRVQSRIRLVACESN